VLKINFSSAKILQPEVPNLVKILKNYLNIFECACAHSSSTIMNLTKLWKISFIFVFILPGKFEAASIRRMESNGGSIFLESPRRAAMYFDARHLDPVVVADRNDITASNYFPAFNLNWFDFRRKRSQRQNDVRVGTIDSMKQTKNIPQSGGHLVQWSWC